VLEWVLWREALLGLLSRRTRLVPEAADVGLYAGLKYGISNPVQRQELQRIWEQVSPPHAYELYSYQPTTGFALIDQVMSGSFLNEVVAWLNSLRGGEPTSLSSAAFTAALERWMMEVHCVLNSSEVRVLQQLAERPDSTQRQLAERLRLSPAAVNGAFKSLSRRHLLRVACQPDLPLLGLYHVALSFRSPSVDRLGAVKAHLEEHAYTRLIREFDDGHLVALMLTPLGRMEQLRNWMVRLCRRALLPPASVRFVTEVISACRFDSYEAKRGWAHDFFPLLLRIQSIIEGQPDVSAPLLHTFRYSYEEVRSETMAPIRLQPADFLWFGEFDRPIVVAAGAGSAGGEEANQPGLSQAEARRYRRRIEWLDARGVRSRPLRLGLLHVGLDVELIIRLQAEPHLVRRIVQACQLLPSLTGVLFDDGGALFALLLPQVAAVDVRNHLRSVFGACGIDASLGLRPAWQAFGTHVLTPGPANYDFDQGAWAWSEPDV
jgi:hypothetical protein